MALLMQFFCCYWVGCAVLTSDGYEIAGNRYFPARDPLSKNEAKNL
jgi:hypothetical protein